MHIIAVLLAILVCYLIARIRAERTASDHFLMMWQKFEGKYYDKCRVIYDLNREKIDMNQTQFLTRIEEITGVQLDGKQRLQIIEAVAKLETGGPRTSIEFVTLVDSGRQMPKSVFISKMIPRINTGRHPVLSLAEITAAVDNVIRGTVHSPLEIEIAKLIESRPLVDDDDGA